MSVQVFEKRIIRIISDCRGSTPLLGTLLPFLLSLTCYNTARTEPIGEVMNLDTHAHMPTVTTRHDNVLYAF